MAKLVLYQGKLLLRGGSLVQAGEGELDPGCCCGGGECCFPSNCDLEWRYGDGDWEKIGVGGLGLPCGDFPSPPEWDCCTAYSIGDPCPDPDEGIAGVVTFARFICDECCPSGEGVNCRVLEQISIVTNPCSDFTPGALELRIVCSSLEFPCNLTCGEYWLPPEGPEIEWEWNGSTWDQLPGPDPSVCDGLPGGGLATPSFSGAFVGERTTTGCVCGS